MTLFLFSVSVSFTVSPHLVNSNCVLARHLWPSSNHAQQQSPQTSCINSRKSSVPWQTTEKRETFCSFSTRRPMKPPARRGMVTADLTWTPGGPAGRRCGWLGWWSRAADLVQRCGCHKGSWGPACAQSLGAGPWSWSWVRCWIFSSWQCHRRRSWTGWASASGRPPLQSLSD